MNTAENKALTPLPQIPSVHIIISGADGVRGMVGGDCPAVREIMRKAVDQFPNDIMKQDSPITPMGQDIYKVSWQFLMSIRGAFSFMIPSDIHNLPSQWPETAEYNLVITL
jgi:hypothetical protein